MTLNYILIGKNIKEARQKMQLSQAALAEKADLSSGYISFIETGARGLSIETFVNLANALGASADELFAENLVFYQLNATGNEFTDVLADCNAYERRVIIESAKETKRILRANRYLLPKTSTKPL
jgi:transcriptional regulator with XRE-family HTH domain